MSFPTVKGINTLRLSMTLSGTTSFTVVDQNGDAHFIEIGQATIDIPISGNQTEITLKDSTHEFFRDRGAFLEKGPVFLAEGLLKNGDLVEVEGICEIELQSEGYRGTKDIKVFRDYPDQPLIIRRLKPTFPQTFPHSPMLPYRIKRIKRRA